MRRERTSTCRDRRDDDHAGTTLVQWVRGYDKSWAPIGLLPPDWVTEVDEPDLSSTAPDTVRGGGARLNGS